MKLKDIESMWANDAHIDITHLQTEAANVPVLHSRYVNIYIEEKLQLAKARADLAELKLEKYEFYTNPPTNPTDWKRYEDMGWELPAKGKILKGEVERYLDGDKHIVKKSLEISVHLEKVELLKSILHTINNRNWTIKNIIEDRNFMHGQ
jgi:hypothetical protein